MLRYGPLLKELQNASCVGRYEYRPPQAGNLDLLIRRSNQIQGISERGGRGCVSRCGRGSHGMSRVRFTKQGQQNEELVPGRDDTTMQCTYYNFSESGHMSFNFPETDRFRGGSGRIPTGILEIRVDFTQP